MTDTNLVRIPWRDGTTREVAEGTACLTGRRVVFAREDGYVVGDNDTHIWPWGAAKVSKVYVEAPEPPLVVEVPTGIGAVAQSKAGPLYVRHPNYWRAADGAAVHQNLIRNILHRGGRVLSEGIDPEQVA